MTYILALCMVILFVAAVLVLVRLTRAVVARTYGRGRFHDLCTHRRRACLPR